jgi:heme/copper-type cytochrome/quinol oxidase subunit 3
LRLALGLTFILGALALTGLVLYYIRLPFDWTTNAYGSIFFTLGGYALVVLACGLAISLFTQFWAWRGRYTAREHLAVYNLLWYWTGAVGVWLVTFGVLFVLPYLGV